MLPIRTAPQVEPMTPERKWYNAVGCLLSFCILFF